MTRMDQVFKAYDIRGTVPDQLDAGMCRAIGRAMARFAQAPEILMARDMRESGVELSKAFSDGVRAEGVNVVDLGMASTDFLYFAAGRLDAPGAMFTASHNPARYNGIKLCLSGARPIGRDTGLAEIEATAESLLGEPLGELSGTWTERNLLDAWAEHVVSFVDQGSLRPLKVVADTANGMGGLVVPTVFSRLPFSVEVLFGELDGNFPNHPADPIQPENLIDLKAAVLAQGADIGLAFDGDADRVFLVDERAEPVSGSLTTALVAASMLKKYPGETILYNLICSHVVPEVVTELGGTPIRTQVGHSIIKAVMAETNAVFGGEHSGHYYYRDNFRDQHRGAEPGGHRRGHRRPRGSGPGHHRPARRPDRRPRRLVVQPATLEHRAAATSQRRSEDARAVRRACGGRAAAHRDLRQRDIETEGEERP